MKGTKGTGYQVEEGGEGANAAVCGTVGRVDLVCLRTIVRSSYFCQ